MTECLMSQLSPNKPNQIIKVRLVRIWNSINPRTNQFMCVDCVAIDAKGNPIHIMIRESESAKFKPILKEGYLYQISRFLISQLKPSRNSVLGNKIITFMQGTQVKEFSQDSEVYPLHYFCFQHFGSLAARVGEVKYLTDVIGALRSIGPVQPIRMPSKNQLVDKCDLMIQELSGKTLRVTIWEELLHQVNDSELLKMTNNPILIIAGATVKSCQGDSYISSCSATKIYIDLDILETRKLKEKYGQELNPVEVFPELDPGERAMIAREEIKVVSIADLFGFNPSEIKHSRFSCKATIMDVDPSAGWFYHSCNQCSKTLQQSGNSFRCIDHGQKIPQLMLKLNMVIEDGKDQMKLLAFAKPAETLINKTIPLIAASEKPDRFKLPTAVKLLLDTQRKLEIGLTNKGILENILDYKLFDCNKLNDDENELLTTKQELAGSSNMALIMHKKAAVEDVPTPADTPHKSTEQEKIQLSISSLGSQVQRELFPEKSLTKKPKHTGKGLAKE